MLPTGRGITSRSDSPVRFAQLGRSDLLEREVEDDKSREKGSEAQQSVESLWHLKGSGSYAEISCIAQKENEPKAVSRSSTVLYT